MKTNTQKKPLQPLKAIKEMCKECMGAPDNPGYRKLIAECPSLNCNLYEFRLGKNPNHTKTLSEEQRKRRADNIRG